LTSTTATWLTNNRRKLDPRYAAGEFFWYFNPTGALDQIMHYAPQYINFANEGKVLGAYGPKITETLPHVINLLKRSPNSRRAVVPLYAQHDIINATFSNDCACTLAYDFMIINDKLCMIATMRSNDVWLGLPYDVFVNTAIQRFVASILGIEPGWYQHQVADLHLYGKNYEAADAAIDECYPADDPARVWGPSAPSNYCEIAFALQHEARYRVYGKRDDLDHITDPTIRTLLQCVLDVPIESEVLEDAYNRRHRLRRQNNAGA
jgi:thymidylate synthase